SSHKVRARDLRSFHESATPARLLRKPPEEAASWPCNSNSVCLGSCRLPDPGARSTDFGLSAGILAAGPGQQFYSDCCALTHPAAPYPRPVSLWSVGGRIVALEPVRM